MKHDDTKICTEPDLTCKNGSKSTGIYDDLWLYGSKSCKNPFTNITGIRRDPSL